MAIRKFKFICGFSLHLKMYFCWSKSPLKTNMFWTILPTCPICISILKSLKSHCLLPKYSFSIWLTQASKQAIKLYLCPHLQNFHFSWFQHFLSRPTVLSLLRRSAFLPVIRTIPPRATPASPFLSPLLLYCWMFYNRNLTNSLSWLNPFSAFPSNLVWPNYVTIWIGSDSPILPSTSLYQAPCIPVIPKAVSPWNTSFWPLGFSTYCSFFTVGSAHSKVKVHIFFSP